MIITEFNASAASGGNPLYITDVANISAQQNLLSSLAASTLAASTTTPTILSGFDLSSAGTILNGGYIYYNGHIYGTGVDVTPTIGQYIFALQYTSSARTTSNGVSYDAYTNYELLVEGTSTPPQAGAILLGQLTANQIARWRPRITQVMTTTNTFGSFIGQQLVPRFTRVVVNESEINTSTNLIVDATGVTTSELEFTLGAITSEGSVFAINTDIYANGVNKGSIRIAPVFPPSYNPFCYKVVVHFSCDGNACTIIEEDSMYKYNQSAQPNFYTLITKSIVSVI